jgi:hypothetical protein
MVLDLKQQQVSGADQEESLCRGNGIHQHWLMPHKCVAIGYWTCSSRGGNMQAPEQKEEEYKSDAGTCLRTL